MKITKIGHCCLIIKEGDCTILTDPGSFTKEQDDVLGIDVVLITHEHSDHLHVESVKNVLKNNPEAKVVTNASVSTILDKEGIASVIVTDGEQVTIKDVLIEGFGKVHAEIYKTVPPVENTGYFIHNKLFYPGDALHNPGKAVEILALPVNGPWLKISEVIDYALILKPKQAFAVHDGLLNEFGAFIPKMLVNFLKPNGITMVPIELNKEIEL